jgi:hypothetical protein
VASPTTERYASSDASRFGAGIFEWWVTPVGEDVHVEGIDRFDGVEVEYVLHQEPDVIEIEMLFPEHGSVSFDLKQGTVAGALPQPQLFEALGADLEVFAGDDVAPRSHTSFTCWAAIGAEAVACAGGGPASPACWAAAAVALAACTGPHCEQIECNQRCTSGGHTYGWCESSDPLDCVCHGIGPAGGGGGGGGGEGGPGCSDDWDCPAWAFCLTGSCS